jgi:hypothetical protein
VSEGVRQYGHLSGAVASPYVAPAKTGFRTRHIRKHKFLVLLNDGPSHLRGPLDSAFRHMDLFPKSSTNPETEDWYV